MKRTTLFNQSLNILLFFALVFSSLAASPSVPAEKMTTQGTGPASGAEAAASTASPVMFVENVGQFEAGARFQAQGGSGSLWLAEDGMWVTLLEKADPVKNDPAKHQPADAAPLSEAAPRKGVNLKLSFSQSNPQPVMEGFNRLETKVSYFKGSDPAQWRADVPVWGGVRYVDLYPGIDLEISSANGLVLQQLVARAGADTQVVQLKVEGMDAMTLDAGALRLSTVLGDYRLPLLQVSAAQAEISPPVLLPGGLLRSPFAEPEAVSGLSDVQTLAGSADLLYATYLGGSGDDRGDGIAVDGSGAAYITGTTGSSNFPTTPGAFDTSLNGYRDAFVVKLNPSGSGLVYATYLGGSGWDYGTGIALDSSGAAYVTGSTGSSDFPTTPGAFDTSYNSGAYYGDAFVAKLNASGSKLMYATYLGGSDDDYGYDIAVDGSGAAYVTGSTGSSDFPATSGAFDTSHNGWIDAFVAKLNPSGSGLVYATYLGGRNWEEDHGIAVDGNGAVYVTGWTGSSNFPTPLGAFDTSFNGSDDAFVVKLNASGSGLVYATYLGGSDWDGGTDIAVDGSGTAYVTGETGSSNFPVTSGAFDTSFNGCDFRRCSDAFVAKLNASGSGLLYATFLGGSGGDYGGDIAVDGNGAAYVTGGTGSSDFPVTPGALDTSLDFSDAFVAKLNPSGTGLVYATFLGGSHFDFGGAIAVDGSGATYVTGTTDFADFPTTPGAFDTSANGSFDAFVAKLNIGRQVCLGLSITQPASGGVIRVLNQADATCPAGQYRQSTTINLQALPVAGSRSKAIWSGVDDSYPGNSASLVLNANRSVTASFIPKKDVIVLVHGILTMSTWTDTCDENSVAYHYSANPHSTTGVEERLRNYFSDLPDKLDFARYDVWIAHVASGPWGTPTLETNSLCLSRQIKKIQEQVQPERLRIIAHSMGGLVSRACISQNMIGCGDYVDDLMTLGSPHAGVNYFVYSWDMAQMGLLEMLPKNMEDFNKYNPNISGNHYLFLGGDSWLDPADPLKGLIGDAIVSKASSMGWTNLLGWMVPSEWDSKQPPIRLWTKNNHVNYFDSMSEAMLCIEWFLIGGTQPSSCRTAKKLFASSMSTADGEKIFTRVIQNTQVAGGNASYPVTVDSSGDTSFLIYWAHGDPTFSLTSPSAQVIDPAFASANPDIATYQKISGEGVPLNILAYHIPNSKAGTWQMHISNNGTDTMTYSAFAQLTSSVTLTETLTKELFAPGETLNIRANLADGAAPVNGAAVSASITRSNGSKDSISMTGQGSGVYTGTYTVPNVPGYATLAINAAGTANTKKFERQLSRSLRFSSNAAALSGIYTDSPLDADGNGKYEALDVQVGVTLSADSEIALSGDLVSATGQMVAHAGLQQSLLSGPQNLTLHFSGADIRASALDGPYTLTNLALSMPALGSIPAAALENAWTGSAFAWSDFAAVCYSVDLGIDPAMGGRVLPDVLPNCGASQYAAGSQVTFSAQAFAGYSFTGWDADLSGATSTKVLTIDSDKLLVAKFIADSVPPKISSTTRLAPNPSASSSLAFRVTFSEPVTGVGTDDFKITKAGITGTPAVTAVTGSGSVYDVTISTGAGSGTLRLDIPATAVIRDLAGNLLISLPYTSGPVYTLDRTGPTVTSIALLDANPSIAARLRYRVTFSENVSGVDAADFVLVASGLSGVSIAGVTGSGRVYDVSANTGAGFGTLKLVVRDNDTIRDVLGNRLGGTGLGNGNYSAGPKYTLDRNKTFTSLPSVDGWVLESTECSGVGGTIKANSVLQLGDDAANKQYRSLLYFNTTGLPDNASITKVTLKIRSAGVVGSNPFVTHGSLLADIRKGFFGTASNLQALDFEAVPSAAGIGKFVALSGAPGWYQLTLSAAQYAYINKAGPTQFRLRFQLDDNNDRGVDLVKFYAGEAVAANRPTLVVEYKIP